MTEQKFMTTQRLTQAFANTYALMLRAQNFHWHVKGEHFMSLHTLFQQDYEALFLFVDSLAERIVMLGERAPSSLLEIDSLQELPSEPQLPMSEEAMLKSLCEGHETVVENLKDLVKHAEQNIDASTTSMATDQLTIHEKTLWMLHAHKG